MKRRHGFTLVELLTVIAIISILIAILLPVLKGVRHRFLVLACPIAYTGVDRRVHLTDPQGGYDVSFETTSMAVSWSPSGRQLAISQLTSSGAGCAGILDPMSRRVLSHPLPDGTPNEFLLWVSEGQFYGFGPKGLYLRDADTGAVADTHKAQRELFVPESAGPLPLQCAPMAFVGVVLNMDTGGRDIALLRKDLTIGRRIPVSNPPMSPRVDPLGEWMAWTDIPSQNHQRIAIKRLRDLPGVMPIICEKEYFRASVCDWSEDGNLILANVTDDNWQTSLVLFDKNGKLVRTLPTAVAPLSGTPVSWRKYGHR